MGRKEPQRTQEEPWVTELLRDILREDSHIPVWRNADEYSPNEESIGIAIAQLPLRERNLIYALYRDELPLQAAYDIDHLSSQEAAAILTHALSELRKPCQLRIAMKGLAVCTEESKAICRLPPEDIVELGIEAMSLPLFVWDAYNSVGIKTIGELRGYLMDADMVQDPGVPISEPIRRSTLARMRELGIWNTLLPAEDDSSLWLNALVKALPKELICLRSEIMLRRVTLALDGLSSIEREVLTGIYRMRHSERLMSLHMRVEESEVSAIHLQALVHLRKSIEQAIEDDMRSVMKWRGP